MSKYDRALSSQVPGGKPTIGMPKINTPNIMIAFSAYSYGIDISTVDNIPLEFNNIISTSINIIKNHKYVPIDADLKRRMASEYHQIDSPYLNISFNPLYPCGYYTRDILKELIKNEGFSVTAAGNQVMYEMLQINHLAPNFFHGGWINYSTIITPIYHDDVRKTPHHQIIGYGIKRSPLIPVTYQELSDTFKHSNVFLNSLTINNDVFSKESILKLYFLCKHEKYPGESADELKIRRDLLKIIKNIRQSELTMIEGEKKFLNMYACSSKQVLIREVLMNLMHMAMYMRGWKGPPEKYPIENTPVDDQMVVDMNVSQAIGTFRKSCEDIGDIGNTIMKLPVYRYKDGKYIPTDPHPNIEDRLFLITAGSELVASCIRTNSNILAATAYKYFKLLSMDPGFDINNLHHIG